MRQNQPMSCRKCGACCEAPSITSPIPGMPCGKPAGVVCINRGPDMTCMIYENRPAVCRNFSTTRDLCGISYDDAVHRLGELESLTAC